MPKYYYLRGSVYYFRHTPRGKAELNISLRTRRLDVAKRKVKGHMAQIQVLEADRDISKCMVARFMSSDSKLEAALKRDFPTVYARVEPVQLVGAWTKEFLRIKASGRKPISYAADRQYAHAMVEFVSVVGDKPITDVTIADVEMFVDSISNGDESEDEISPRTVANKFSCLRSVFALAERRGVVPMNVVNRVDRPPYDEKHVLSPPFDMVDKLCDLPRMADSRLSEETWSTLPLCFRYTGCRLDEICGLLSEGISVEEGIPIIRVRAGKAELRQKNLFPGGMKTVPVHPRLWPHLQQLKKLRHALVFSDSGQRNIGSADRPKISHGRYFSCEYNTQARTIWPHMRVHAWRSYLCSYLTKVAGVPEMVSQDIAGHAGGTVHRDYAGLAPLSVRYEAVKKLP
jgi:integrase